jgi:hypothetical protein
VRFVPLALSSLLVAAHFLRSGDFIIAILCLAAPLLLILRKPAITIAVQVMLVIAAAEWLRTAFAIAQERAASGTPTVRMFAILGSVALFTLLSAAPLKR